MNLYFIWFIENFKKKNWKKSVRNQKKSELRKREFNISRALPVKLFLDFQRGWSFRRSTD